VTETPYRGYINDNQLLRLIAGVGGGSGSIANIDADLGATTDAPAASDTGTASLIALTKRLLDTKLKQGFQAPATSLSTLVAQRQMVTFGPALAAINTDLLSNTVNGWLDVSGYSFISFTIEAAAGAAGTLTFEQSNSNTIAGTAPAWVVSGGVAASTIGFPSSNVILAAGTNYNFFGAINTRFIRIRANPAVTGGNVTLTAALSQLPTVAGANVQVPQDFVRIGNVAVGNVFSGWNGATNISSMPVNPIGPIVSTDYSAVSVAAVSGSLTINSTSTNGPAQGFAFSLTAWTAGASIGLDLFLQISMDDGTTWTDVYQCEPFTATGVIQIPAIPITGRKRVRWVNRGGAATTATLTVRSNSTANAVPRQRQFYDRTTGVGSGTVTATTNSAAYNIEGCRGLTIKLFHGTATANATFRPMMSDDGINWAPAGPTVSPGNLVAGMFILPTWAGATGSFLRIESVAAGTSQVMNYIAINAIQ
jgi:hypothetical protein